MVYKNLEYRVMRFPFSVSAILLVITFSIKGAEAQWIELFNGQDLSNWQVKFTGFPLGDNFRDTFVVEDGLLKVSYDNWSRFDGEFGHLFTKNSYSNYRLRVEYRFVGDQVIGGPSWAYKNNGMMLHSQAPETMALDQEFPVSIEVQMLGGQGEGPRPNANVCTPGTNMVMKGLLVTQHCTNSISKTYSGDDWVVLEIEVSGSQKITHLLDNEAVLEYEDIQLDPDDKDAQKLIVSDKDLLLDRGYIAIQAETAPIEFRKIEILPL